MEVGSKMIARNREIKSIPRWLIFDDATRKSDILGWIPGRLPPEWIRDGFVKRADTIEEELARQCEIDAGGLTATLERFNDGARRGVDTEFHRGESAYDQFLGDPYHKPNKCITTIDERPFYAIAVFPSDVGTFGGLVTDDHARVSREDGQPIAGLYATGNTTADVGGLHSIGAGASIGPTCTWGFMRCTTSLAAPASSARAQADLGSVPVNVGRDDERDLNGRQR
jgi:3-oxosteroid 1-dehydrogenase